MSQTFTEIEIRGRLLLWQSTLITCQPLLKLRSRCLAHQESAAFKHRDSKYSKDLLEFIREQPDYIPGKGTKSSHIEKFRQENPPEFPSLGDLHVCRDACELASITIFCQMLNAGHSHAGNVAPNSDAFRNEHFEKLLSGDSFTQETRKKAQTLIAQCLSVRNQLIAHADAGAYDVQQGRKVSSIKLISGQTREIDFSFMAEFIDTLLHAVGAELASLQPELPDFPP